MKKLFLYTIAAIGLFGCKKNEVTKIYPQIMVSGYVADTTVATAPNQNIQKLDRVIFFAIAPDATGAFQLPAADSISLSLLKTKMTGNQQLFVSLGGPGASANMATMAHDATKQTAYVNSVVSFCKRWNVQGIDLDWEMTGTAPTAPTFPNATDYVALCQQMSAALHAEKNPILFSEAIGIYYAQFSTTVVADNSYFNLANLTYNYADQINVLAYGGYAMDPTLYYQSSMQQMQNWLGILKSYGVPESKVVTGVPFNGYHNALGAPADSTANLMPYSAIAQYNPAPAANMYMNFGYNGTQLLQDKMQYLRSKGYGGILASDISSDVSATAGNSLLKAIITANAK
jgi:GH18 family chitinase